MGWARLLRYLTLIAVVLAGGIYLVRENDKKAGEESRKRQAMWEAWSRSAIELKELHFSGVHLRNRSYGPYMALNGTVANHGKHALGEFDVEVILKDCENKTKETNCKVVGQARGTAAPNVRSGQSQSFHTSDLQFDNLPREIQVRCATQPCNAGRVFSWRVTGIRAMQ
jgi:hypothetical protein